MKLRLQELCLNLYSPVLIIRITCLHIAFNDTCRDRIGFKLSKLLEMS